MRGKILGFDTSNNSGTILADNGERYKFSKEDCEDSTFPKKEMMVDFEQSDENSAKDIYIVKDIAAENSTTLLGLVAVGITFFFAFIGTFVSRLFIAKEPMGSVIVPTAIHLVLTILVIVPFVGWIIYFISTFYYMYKNYNLVTQPQSR